MSICVICGDYLLQSKQINMFLRSLRLQNIIILLKIMKERQIVMDLCTNSAKRIYLSEIKRVRRITPFSGNELATVLIAVVCIALLV